MSYFLVIRSGRQAVWVVPGGELTTKFTAAWKGSMGCTWWGVDNKVHSGMEAVREREHSAIALCWWRALQRYNRFSTCLAAIKAG